MYFRLIVVGIISVMMAGCAGGPALIGRPDLKIVQGDSLPAPTSIDLIAERRAYAIGPLDQLSVDVYGVPELSRSVQVDAGGKISMPLVGSLDAAGKEPNELAALIQAQLGARYVRDPKVTVNITETNSQLVTVDGEVKVPGPYPVAGRMTLVRAIAKAQGTTEFAKTDKVVVFRRVNNQDMVALFDLGAIQQGAYADPPIFANDVIIVGNSRARRVFKDILQVTPLLITPLIAVFQRI